MSKTPECEKITDRLSKMLTKYEGLFDTTQLHIVQESMERVESGTNLKIKEVNVNGKMMIISDPIRKFVFLLIFYFLKFRPKEEITESKQNLLRKSYNNYKYELSDEDDEDGRYDLAAKFEAEVGISGRFNRPEIERNNDINESNKDTENLSSYRLVFS